MERTPELGERIRALYLSGKSLSETSRVIGISRLTLDRLMHFYGIKKREKQDQSGPNHYLWKGGLIWRAGYACVYSPGHHRLQGRKRDNHVRRADIVLEEKLGRRLLPNEIAHHINRIRSDDHPDNLEVKTKGRHAADHNQEAWNRNDLRRNNTTGVVGVGWDATNEKYIAVIYVNGKSLHLGRFSSLEEAAETRAAAEIKYRGSSEPLEQQLASVERRLAVLKKKETS